jgi:hypothetical protein
MAPSFCEKREAKDESGQRGSGGAEGWEDTGDSEGGWPRGQSHDVHFESGERCTEVVGRSRENGTGQNQPRELVDGREDEE